MSYEKVLVGDTIKFTAISSGDTFTAYRFNLISGSETLVNSATMVDSGNGHLYYNYTVPDSLSAGFYTAELKLWINSLSYVKKHRIKVVYGEVD